MRINERAIMCGVLGATLAFGACASPAADAPAPAKAPSTAASHPAVHVAHDALKKLGWQLAVPVEVFPDRTVSEAIDLLHGLDVHHLELEPGHPLSWEDRAATAGHAMTDAQVDALLAKLKSVRMDVVTYGPVDLRSDAAPARAAFAFAKRIKAKTVIVIPPPGGLESLDKLAAEFDLKVAVAVEPGAMKDPKLADVVKAVEPLSARVGVYADLNFWRQAGVAVGDVVGAMHGHVTQVRVSGPTTAPSIPTAADTDEAALARLRRDGFKGIVTAACKPGAGDSAVDAEIVSLNALSAALEKVAAEP